MNRATDFDENLEIVVQVSPWNPDHRYLFRDTPDGDEEALLLHHVDFKWKTRPRYDEYGSPSQYPGGTHGGDWAHPTNIVKWMIRMLLERFSKTQLHDPGHRTMQDGGTGCRIFLEANESDFDYTDHYYDEPDDDDPDETGLPEEYEMLASALKDAKATVSEAIWARRAGVLPEE
ncbi:hypothetical protein [Rhodococcoides fascians]|uniref:hypothetical protein n=1 Tax=Rhodococcoides fascians TaxID=1828 RepID=UPI00056125C6|nr:hypothetical protein [Rhodococcus fascians]